MVEVSRHELFVKVILIDFLIVKFTTVHIIPVLDAFTAMYMHIGS